MVEHLLPSLLGANYSLSQQIQERNLFFGELATALEVLHGKLTIISSPPRGPREDAQYPWLWRYVSHFSVGFDVRVVQHAKLWAFHWKTDVGEFLELHVSSMNLTTSAFRDQVQAGWHVTLPLGAPAAQNTRKTWGEFVLFLDALGASAGPVAVTRVQRLITLLGRVECPADVTFVASIPGRKSAGRQLALFDPSEIHVLSPTIGEWNEKTLSAWTADVGVHPNKVHLKWISELHPWAAVSGWGLSKTAARNLERGGVQLECLPNDARLTEDHLAADPRWSHAKLYLLRSRRKRRVLITSANWSASAWGAGRSAPRNFELGVIFESQWTDIEHLGEPFDPPKSVPYCVDRVDEKERESALEWAEASWDGKCIAFHARSTDETSEINVVTTFIGGTQQSAALVDSKASISWNNAECTPLIACFKQGAEALEVDVIDVRSPREFVMTPLPEVDQAIEKAIREAFLLQRYGGPIIGPELTAGIGAERQPKGVGAPAADYAVQAWIDARAAFSVIDKWRSALDDASADARLLERVRMDGAALHTLFSRRGGPAASIVVEELGWRLGEKL